MKIILIIFLLMSVNCSQIDEKYYKSIEYIKTSKIVKDWNINKLPISVSDSVVFLGITSFFDKFIKTSDIKKHQQNKLLDSLIHIENVTYFDTYYLCNLSELGDVPNSKVQLFFSKPFDNYLIAELFYKNNSLKGYNNISMFNKSLMFLFVFDKENEIEKVFTTKIIYN